MLAGRPLDQKNPGLNPGFHIKPVLEIKSNGRTDLAAARQGNTKAARDN